MAIERAYGASLTHDGFPAFRRFNRGKEAIGEVGKWNVEADDCLSIATAITGMTCGAIVLVEARTVGGLRHNRLSGGRVERPSHDHTPHDGGEEATLP